MTKNEALKLALEALDGWGKGFPDNWGDLDTEAVNAIKEALAQPEQEQNKNGSPCPEFWDWLPKAYNFEGDGNFTKYNMEVAFLAGKQASQPEQEPVAWKYDVIYNQDGTVSVALPDGDELRIVLPNQQESYCWTWDEFVSGGKWRAEYGWKKPTKKVVNLQPLYTTPSQRTWVGLTDEEMHECWDSPLTPLGMKHVRMIEAKLKEKNI